METFGMIILLLAIVGIYLLISRGANKAGNALERAIRPDAASKENDLLETVTIFTTSKPLSDVRRAIGESVVVGGNLLIGRMTTLHDSEREVAWEVGAVSVGAGFKAQLVYRTENGKTIGEYSITSHSTKAGVSQFIKKMTELRNQVIEGFQKVDPEVKVTTEKQEITRKTKW